MFLQDSQPLPVCAGSFYPLNIGWKCLQPPYCGPESTDKDNSDSPFPSNPPNFAKRRRKTFWSGRRAAYEALLQVGFPDSLNAKPNESSIGQDSVSEEQLLSIVGRNADRSPHWPDGFIGSISHSDHWIVAVAAKLSHYQSIGIDTEIIVTKPVADSLRQDIGDPKEWKLLEDAGIEQSCAFTLLFSAKEAFYKCWYPLQKRFLDFLEVRAYQIRPNRDPSRTNAKYGEIDLQLVENHGSSHQSEAQISQVSVRYCLSADDVFTLALLKNEQATSTNQGEHLTANQ